MKVKIVHGRGPMSDELDRRWGFQYSYWQAYDWTIYCVNTPDPPSHVIEHEVIHFKQQDEYGDVDAWWQRYLDDEEFRLCMEAEAYANDVVQGHRTLTSALGSICSSLYGSPDRETAKAILNTAIHQRMRTLDTSATLKVEDIKAGALTALRTRATPD